MSLRAVREITGALLGGEQLDVVLRLVAAHARRVAGADVAMITAAGEPPEEAVVVVAVGRDAARLRGRRGTQTELLTDLGPRVCVPLRARGRNHGTLVVANRGDGAYLAPEDVEVVETFAQQAALAFDTVGSANRERLDRDMHDNVIQRLYAAGLTLESLKDADLAPAVAERIARTVEALDAMIREIRGTIFAFEPGPDGTGI